MVDLGQKKVESYSAFFYLMLFVQLIFKDIKHFTLFKHFN